MPERMPTPRSDEHILPAGADSSEQQAFERGKQLIDGLMARQTHQCQDAVLIQSAGHPQP